MDKHTSRLVILFSLVFAGATFAFAAFRCVNFQCGMTDLGSFYQVIEAMRHGHVPMTTLQPPYHPQHWFGVHFSPILYLAAPLVMLWPSPLVLQLLQSLLVASTAIPVFLTARTWQLPPASACALVLMFFLNPFVISGTLWDFHEIAFAVPTFAWMMYAVATRKFNLLILSSVVLLLTKEHYGLAVAGAGLLWAMVYPSEKKRGLALAISGVAALIFILAWLMPHFAGGNAASALEMGGLGDKRYGWISKAFEESAIGMRVLKELVPQWLLYAIALLLPFYFLPLKSFWWLLPIAADMAANKLSYAIMPRAFLGYHSLPMIAILIIATGRTISHQPQITWRKLLILPVAFFIFYLSHAHGPFYWEIHRASFRLSEPDRQIIHHIQKIYRDHPHKNWAVQNNIGMLLDIPVSQLNIFPQPLGQEEIIVAKLDFPFSSHIDKLDMVYTMPPEAYIDALTSRMIAKNYSVILFEQGWLVVEKGPPKKSAISKQTVLTALEALRVHIRNVSENTRRPLVFF